MLIKNIADIKSYKYGNDNAVGLNYPFNPYYLAISLKKSLGLLKQAAKSAVSISKEQRR